MTDLRQRISRIGYVLLLAWIALFIVLVGHVWWDDPNQMRYITSDIWFDILSVMIGVPLGGFIVWLLLKRLVRPQDSS
jgi:Na+/phosphate symporter